MAAATTVPIGCPDCTHTFHVPVTIVRRHEDTERDGMVLADVKLDEVAFTAEFTEHVMADPENHPTFTTRDDSDTQPA